VNDPSPISLAAVCASLALLAFAAGAAYFAALRLSITLFVSGRGWRVPLALTLGRVGAAVILLAIVAKLGALPLLATFVGFLAARAVALRAAGRGR